MKDLADLISPDGNAQTQTLLQNPALLHGNQAGKSEVEIIPLLPSENPKYAETKTLPSFHLLKDNDAAYTEVLSIEFPELAKARASYAKILKELRLKIQLIEADIDILQKREKSQENKQQIAGLNDERKRIIDAFGQADKEASAFEEKCDEAILTLYSSGANKLRKRINPNYDEDGSPVFTQENTDLIVSSTESVGEKPHKFATPAYQELALCLAGINAKPQQYQNPSWLANHCGLTVPQVMEAGKNAQFTAYVSALCTHFAKELVRRGLNTKIARLQQANATLEGLEQIRFERSMLWTLDTEVSDEDLLSMGLNPDKRNPLAAMVPGASTGLIKQTPVVVRVQGGESRGGRSQILHVYEVDNDLLRNIKMWTEFISKELGEFGTDNNKLKSDEIKTYAGFDPTQV